MPISSKELADQAIASAQALLDVSRKAIDAAHDLLNSGAPEMPLEKYQLLVLHHSSVVAQASQIIQTAQVTVAANLDGDLDALKKVTSELNQKMAVLSKVQQAVDVSAKVLYAVGTLALVVAAPSAATLGSAVAAIAAVAS